MALLAEIKHWFDKAKKIGSTHMIVVCDQYDHEDYPIGVYSKIDAEKCLKEYDACNGKNMQQVMEVYDISKGWDAQVNGRVMNLPPRK